MTKVAVRVQHHPSRVDLAERLLGQLARFDDVQVVEDPDPNGHRNAWRAHRACLEAMPQGATHLLAIQDDAIPNTDFHDAIIEAITARSESVILPFVPGFTNLRKLMGQARSRGEVFMRFDVRAYVPVVAIVYPASVVHDLLAWTTERNHRRGADDGIVAFYCKARRIVPVAMLPCVCDHDDTAKTIGAGERKGPHRRAAML